MKYNWEKVAGFNDIYKKVRKNTLKYTRNLEITDRFMGYFEDFMLDCLTKKYINSSNFKTIMDRLNRLEAFSNSISYDSKPGFTTDDRSRIYINKNVMPELERLYVYKELSKVITSLTLLPARNIVKERGFNLVVSGLEEDIYDFYELEGWKSLEETLAQEIAESLFYIKLNIPRPRMRDMQDEELVGNKISFKSNLKKHQLEQSILIAIARRLDENKLADLNDEQVLELLVKKAFKEDFNFNLIKEYIDMYGADELHYIIGNMGMLAARENALNNEGFIRDQSITQKKSIASYKNINEVFNPQPKKKWWRR